MEDQQLQCKFYTAATIGQEKIGKIHVHFNPNKHSKKSQNRLFLFIIIALYKQWDR